MSSKMWKLCYSKQALRDLKKLQESHLVDIVARLLNVVRENPLKVPPPFEKLICSNGRYSRRINIKHRLVYEINTKDHSIYVVRMWGHYDDN